MNATRQKPAFAKRIRSAQLGERQPCMQSRKHDSISDEDIACLIAPGHSD